MKYTAIKGTSVFIVLEHSWIDKSTRPHTTHDAVVHGVYSNRENAVDKANKILFKDVVGGYVCVLKKTIQGKKPKVEHCSCEEYGINTFEIKE